MATLSARALKRTPARVAGCARIRWPPGAFANCDSSFGRPASQAAFFPWRPRISSLINNLEKALLGHGQKVSFLRAALDGNQLLFGGIGGIVI